MNNSFHSDNFIFPINVASQVLTLSNILSQSPEASPPRPSRKVHQRGCIDEVPLNINHQPVSSFFVFAGVNAGFDKAENGRR